MCATSEFNILDGVAVKLSIGYLEGELTIGYRMYSPDQTLRKNHRIKTRDQMKGFLVSFDVEELADFILDIVDNGEEG